ncbi:MAG: hypothetical protein AMXMBFR58_25130 [Phycisphaerae bacterium]|nr:response regulator [Phycisphaerales bacterium]
MIDPTINAGTVAGGTMPNSSSQSGQHHPSPPPKSAPIVLVVDDCEDIREALARLLRSDGYTPAQAADGGEALTYLRETIPALIITDLSMPGMDGIELVHHIRHDARTRAVPIIMFSATGGSAVEQAHAAGVQGYVLKESMDWAKLRQDILRLAGPGIRDHHPPAVISARARDAS